MRQTVRHGATIETVTPAELADFLRDFSRAGHIGYGSDRIEKKLENWPVMGHERTIRVNASHGNSSLGLVPNTYTDLFIQNAGRGGLSIINIGNNPCWIFGETAANAQNNNVVPSGYLFANGGAWDGRIGRAEWVGHVSALSVLGTTLVLWEA
jgi:hypothetical protein